MKRFIVLGLTISSLSINAQIKVWAGGTSVIGSTSATSLTGHKMQVIGKTVFTSGTGTSTSSAYIVGANAYSGATTPDYTWKGDSICGLFHPAAGKIGFTTGGVEYMRLTTSSLLIGGTTDNVGKIGITVTDNYSQQTFHTATYNGAYAEVMNVNRDATKAWVLFNTSTGSPVLKYYVAGDGAVWCKTLTQWSDRNLKENIDTVRGALNKVKQLQGYTYNFKGDASDKEMGLIAQDVEQVAPEVVVTNEKGVKGINYGSLTALFVEAIKEQGKQIAQLQADLVACCNKTGNRIIQDNGSGDGSGDDGNQRTGNQGMQVAKLWQNTPNPFNQTTLIKCYIPDASKMAMILIFDLTGALKKTVSVNGKAEVNVTLSAKELVAGMYNYSLIVDGQEVDTKKMILTE